MKATKKTALPTRHSAAGVVRIGISGWRYAGWRAAFYPKGLAQRRELEYASRMFSSIEINGTFYSLQRPTSFAQWAAETPDDFVFSLKGSRFITHMKKLRDVEEALANYFAQGLLLLGAKMGPILWQFPPYLTYDRARFEDFFRRLPRSTKEASVLAASHSPRLRGRASTEVERDRPMRHCVEIRHESFVVPEFIAFLREHDVGLVVADAVEWPLLMDVTSDFVYCRLHGSEVLYTSGYDGEALDMWAARVNAWAAGEQSENGRFASTINAQMKKHRDVFVYFDNDAKVRAPHDAKALKDSVDKAFP